MAKLLACGARGPGFDSGLAATISEIGYPLLPSGDMAETTNTSRRVRFSVRHCECSKT